MPGYEICFNSNHSVSLFDSIGTSWISLEDIAWYYVNWLPLGHLYIFNCQLIYVSVFFSTIGLRLARTLNFGWVKLNMSFFDKGGE